MAAPVEDASGIHHHAGRMDFSRNDPLWLNLNAALREDHAIKSAGDHNPVPLDLTFDLSVLSEDYSVFGDDVALNVPVDAKCPCDGERSFEQDALIDESCPLFARAVLC